MTKKLSIIFGFIFIAALGVVALLFSPLFAQSQPFCGDGVIQSPNFYGEFEKCDDGNTANGDGCSAGVVTSGANPNGCAQESFGWAWSSNIGWVSLSCYNQGTCTPALGGIDYWVSITSQNTVKGWAWSSNMGWLCFGETCSTVPGFTAPPFGSLEATVDPSTNEVDGWAWYTALGDNGWISLNCINEQNQFVDFSCDSDSNYQTSVINKDFCAFFEGNQTACQAQGCNYDTGTQACSGGETRLSLSGFSWNPKVGWLQFDPPINIIPPWLQTRFGDIYTLGGINADAPSNQFTATFRILSNGGIASAIRSEQGNEIIWINPTFGAIDFPTPDTAYSNILGQLNIAEMTSCSTDLEAPGECLNRFGQVVKKIQPTEIGGIANIGPGLTNPLGGKIYHFENSGTITSFELSGYIFANGLDFSNGAGTIVIDGDLEINDDVTYAPSASNIRFRNLASVAIIVKGDLKISNNVDNLDGNFIVIGDGTADLPHDCTEDEVLSASCGQIYTCSERDSASCDNDLTVSGMMMARRFFFERTFTSESRGSELIIYDGRLLANTPPGLTDFAKALPIWRSGTFSQ